MQFGTNNSIIIICTKFVSLNCNIMIINLFYFEEVKYKLYDHLKIISSYFYYFEINSIFAINNYR